jgi:tRNA(Arg) A34 adenosine deaminase TadA
MAFFAMVVMTQARIVNHFMERAIELSLENVHAGLGGPFAALVVKDGTILATGTNQVTTAQDPTAHAEIVAIRGACRAIRDFQLPGCELYTTCEPCPMCMGAIYWARLARVYYANTREDAARIGFDDSFIYDQLNSPVESRQLPMIQLMREPALAAFREWEKSKTKIQY